MANPNPLPDQSGATLASCPWCGHVHDPEDGRCDAHAHVGVGRCTCPGPSRLREAEDHLWAMVVWFGRSMGDGEPYVARDITAADSYLTRHCAAEDMTARHRQTLSAASDESQRGMEAGDDR